MIPRYQKIILWVLLGSSVLMAAFLIRFRAHLQDQLLAIPDAVPMAAPVEAPPVAVTWMFANDADGSLTPVERSLALPAEATTRAKTLLNALLAAYAEPSSPHPLLPVPAINDVFLLPVQTKANAPNQGQMAVVNFSGNFAAHHPSGIEVETLTLLSILGTLHANMPAITQVRFLVDGQPKDTLAGHADLTRTYLTANDVPTTVAPPNPQ